MEQINNISALNKFKEHESTLKYANSTIELTDLKTIVENGIKFFSTRLKNQINRIEKTKLSSEQKVENCFENNYFLNEYLLLLDKINLRLKLTSFVTIKDYKFYNVQILPFEKNSTTFEIFEKIISEKFTTFGVDGFYRPFLIELIESYYNEMLQKSIELQRTLANQTQLTKNFNALCIDWLTFILDQYNEANKKEAPHYIKPFLDYCKAKEPKQPEVENNDSENEASKDKTITETKIKDYKNTIWFQVGLSFANGEMDSLLTKYNRNFTKIANEHFKNKSYRQYINETANWENYDSDKNIFKRPEKLLKIHSYCFEKGIKMTDFFIRKFNESEPK
jgi:hypothetical protein